MVRRRRTKNFVVSGGILTIDFLLNLQEEEPKQPLIKPNTFSIPPNLIIENQNQLDNMIKESWERLLEKWDEISIKLKSMNESDSKQKWTIPLLKALDFIDIQYSSKDIAFEDGKIQVFISHRGWARADAPKIHIVGPNQELDSRLDTDRNNKSPHDSLQLYLKMDKSLTKWGIVTNGLQIRLLRDFFHTHTRGYVEFDLESIFYERNFTDFRVLYRLIHASRFLKDENNQTILDIFYEKSVAAGTKIGEGLRENVKKAIELIGNGLLTHEMRELMILNEDITKEFYQEILRIIYRILFLMFAEQRGMLPMHNSLYVEEYSITKLRERAETRIVSDNHSDLWHGLFSTFSLIREGSVELDVFGYNGDLFDDSNFKHTQNMECRNDFLLGAIKNLTLYEKGKVLQRINFLELGVEEIGAIYESLLDFTPRLLKKDEEINNTLYRRGEFILDPRGAGRKTTGSYYTDSKLIAKLIDSALKPIFDKAIDACGEEKEKREKAILNLKVCDPACGSGAFLIAVNNFLGKELAKIRAETEYPPESIERQARRDILSKCIYGVDLNPMAIELTKVSLWINAAVNDFPLNLLNHHLKCGNSLIGTNKKSIRNGILNEAFQPVRDEDKVKVRIIRNENEFQRKHVKMVQLDKFLPEIEKIELDYQSFIKLDVMVESTKADTIKKRSKYLKLIEDEKYKHQKLIYDTWASTFFWPFSKMQKSSTPTNSMFKAISNNTPMKGKEETITKVKELASGYNFFHWEVEFPEVFRKEKGGFDCIIGNPPWEKVNIKEKEFFEAFKPEIANARNAATRKDMIKTLEKIDQPLWLKFQQAQEQTGKFIHFLKNSSLFTLTSKGLVNLFAIFTEKSLSLINDNGLVGLVIPSNIMTDFNFSEFYETLIVNNQLVSLYDFINRKGIFSDLHRMYKFCLFTSRKKCKENSLQSSPEFIFNLTDLNKLENERKLHITYQDIELLNPNTKTCPMFSDNNDYELTKKIYKNSRIILNHTEPLFPELKVHRMFNMSDDSKHFKIKETINNFVKDSNTSIRILENIKFLPIYESKFIWIFDYRFAGFNNCTGEDIIKGHPKQADKNISVLNYHIEPRYWIDNNKFMNKKNHWGWDYNWFLGVRLITNAKNWRTCIATIIPNYPSVNSLNLILNISPKQALFLVSSMSSLVFDYCTRQKLVGVNLNQFLLEQLPVVEYSTWEKFQDMIIPKSIELLYTSEELRDFAMDCGYDRPPYQWDEERRFILQAELDAIFALLYGISKQDLIYIIDTFSIQKQKDILKFKDYKTKITILKYYDKYSDLITEDIE